MKVVNLKAAYLTGTNPGDYEFLVSNFSMRRDLDQPTRYSITIPFESLGDNKLVGSLFNLQYGGEAIGYGFIESIDAGVDALQITGVGTLGMLDFYPILERVEYKEGTGLQDVISDLIGKAGFPGDYIQNFFSYTLPADKEFGNGQTLYDALLEIVDMAGGWMVERKDGRIWLLSYSNLPGGGNISLDEEMIQSEFHHLGSDQLYSQVFVRDAKSKVVVKKYAYQPFPFNRRAIFYTYNGLITEDQAKIIAESIYQRLFIGKEKVSYVYGDMLNLELLSKVNGYLITAITINYNLEGSDITTTLEGFSL